MLRRTTLPHERSLLTLHTLPGQMSIAALKPAALRLTLDHLLEYPLFPDVDPSRLDPFGRSVEALKGSVGAGSRGKIRWFELGVKRQLPITITYKRANETTYEQTARSARKIPCGLKQNLP